jgi:hypothetical protein
MLGASEQPSQAEPDQKTGTQNAGSDAGGGKGVRASVWFVTQELGE